MSCVGQPCLCLYASNLPSEQGWPASHVALNKQNKDAKAAEEVGDLNDMEFLLRAKHVKAKVHIHFTVP